MAALGEYQVYYIEFTDGSKLCDHSSFRYADGDFVGPLSIPFPFIYIQDYKGDVVKFTGTKTDLDGNVWRFTDTTVFINDVNLLFNFAQHPYGSWIEYDENRNVIVSMTFDNVGSKSKWTDDRAYFAERVRQITLDERSDNTFYHTSDVTRPCLLFSYLTTSLDPSGQPIKSVLLPGWSNSSGNTISLGDDFSLSRSRKTYVPESDPYEQGGSSTKGGGTGTFDDSSEDIPFPNLPELSASDTGFVGLFNPTLAQLKNLSDYMWSNLFDIDTLKKLFADPMDCILGLSIVPVAVPNEGAQTVKVGNISTGVSMNKATSQYVELDCGTLNVREFWGSYLDYSPYTKIGIYLPYIGYQILNIDDVMDKAVHVKYHVDVLTGSCVAYIACDGSVTYQFQGQCAVQIPITSNDWSSTISSAIGLVSLGVATIATGGLAAAGEIGAAGAVGVAASAAPNLASTVMGSKPQIANGGQIGSMGGMLAVQKPYLIMTRPRQSRPVNQNLYTGYPSNMTATVSTLSGYTEWDFIDLSPLGLTEPEVNELLTIMRNGVYL